MSARVDHATVALALMSPWAAVDERGRTIDMVQADPEQVAIAQVHATLALVEQQRIANALQVALVDQLTAIAPYLTPVGAQVDPSIRIRDYLDEGQWGLITPEASGVQANGGAGA